MTEEDIMTERERDESDLVFLKAADIILSRRLRKKAEDKGMTSLQFGQLTDKDKSDALLIRLLRDYISDMELRINSDDYGKEDAE